MKPFRVAIRVKNNRLIKLREDLGLSGRAFAEKAGVHYSAYMEFENLKRSPISEHRPGEWKAMALAIAEFHGVSPEWIWPDEIKAFRARALQLEATAKELVRLPPPPVLLEQKELRTVLGAYADARLTPLERKIVREHLVSDDPRSHQEIGDEHCISKARVSQLEQAALRKLRHMGKLKDGTEQADSIVKGRELLRLEARERFGGNE